MRHISLLILTDTALAGPGGSERFLRYLIAHLDPAQYRIDVLQLSPEPEADGRVADVPRGEHLRIEHYPIGPIYGAAGLGAYAAVARRVLAGRYDVVQSQHEKSDFINALLPRGPRGARRISCRRDMGFQKTDRVRRAFRTLNRRFDRIVAPTGAILQGLVDTEHAMPARMLCIPNGVDAQRFAPVDVTRRAALRVALGYGPQHLVYGCVASFSPIKRHVDLIAAFAQVAAALPQARLLLVGEGALRPAVEQQIRDLGLGEQVQLTGARGDVPDLLAAFDVSVLSSNTEGLSNAIIEAQASALPVVATAVGGNPDLVIPGVNGRLVPAHDVAALAAALIDTGRDDNWRARAGAAAREQVLRHHSLAAMAGAYDRLYRELLVMPEPHWAGTGTPGPQ